MLSIINVTRAFDSVRVLRGVDLEVERGEIVCLLGPSGCGKTTLLRIVAGLERADSGDVRLDGESILNQPIHTRDFGLMFQDFALFPHMNVAGNVEFGLRMKGLPPDQRRERIGEVLELVGLSGFERRDVNRLSGGERQRVALARSLAPRLRLLMLDEPFGSLDAVLRERLVVEIGDIIKQIGLTSLYVTHDRREAFAIADRIAIMNAGRFEQVGAPADVYRQPETAFAARFLGLSNILPVTAAHGSTVQTPLGRFPIPQPVNGAPAAILLHPDGIDLADGGSAPTIDGVVTESVFQGDSTQVQMRAAGSIVLAFKLSSRDHAPLRPGDQIQIAVSTECILPLRE